MEAPRNLGPEYQKYNDPIYQKLAKQLRCAALSTFVLDGVAMNPKLNQADGIHPNPAGVKIIVGKMLPYVEKLAAEAKH